MTVPEIPVRAEAPSLVLPSAGITMAGMVAGLLCGAAAHRWTGSGWDLAIGVLEPLGTMWLAVLRMLVLPLMVSVLIVAIGRAGSGQAGRLGWSSLSWFVCFLAVAAVATILLGQLVIQAIPVDEATRSAFQAAARETAAGEPPLPSPTIRDWFVNLVPPNLFAAATRGDLLPVIVATLLFGAAFRYVPVRGRDILLDLAQAIADWCFALAGLLFRVLPVAVFILTLVSTARSGAGLASGLVYYVALVSAFLAVGTLLLYPVTVWLGRVPASRFARAVWPVQVLAFSTRSSVACLPAMLNAARRGLRLPENVSNVTLPLAVSSFKLNVAISANFQLLFLLHVYGRDPDPVTLSAAVAALTLQSFATPGLPSGAIWTTTPVYLALGIPLEGIVLTNVVDTIPDLFKTTANVTADLSIAAIVARRASPPQEVA